MRKVNDNLKRKRIFLYLLEGRGVIGPSESYLACLATLAFFSASSSSFVPIPHETSKSMTRKEEKLNYANLSRQLHRFQVISTLFSRSGDGYRMQD